MNRGDRIEAPLIRSNGGSKVLGWKDALQSILKAAEGSDASVKAVATARASNEDLAAFKRLI